MHSDAVFQEPVGPYFFHIIIIHLKKSCIPTQEKGKEFETHLEGGKAEKNLPSPIPLGQENG